jgi:hypothetical protein
MTPKEKAKELLKFYLNFLPKTGTVVVQNSKEISWSYDDCETAKQCALIAVDEIITTLNYDIRDLDVRGNVLLDLLSYWQEVKQEIEKL